MRVEGRIVLSDKEIHRSRVLEAVQRSTLTLKEASVLLGVSYRQAKRLRRRYAKAGIGGLAHGNRGRRAPNALDPTRKAQILALDEGKYRKFNDTHFAEMLLSHEEISVSRETLRRLRRAAGRGPKRKRRPPKYRSRRPPKERMGALVQWDGSPHPWFGPDHPACCLLTAIDDATGRLLGALFVPSECAEGYLRLLDIVLRDYGAPLAIYHDRHTIFVRSDGHWSIEEELQGEQYPTNVGRALEELDIVSIPANSPQAKGRVERGFGTLQDRLVAELDFEGITDIHTANQWLQQSFIPRYNKRFGRKPASEKSAFRKLPTRDRYNLVCFAYEVTVSNDNCVRLGGLTIDIPQPRSAQSYAKKKVLVRQHLDGAWSVWLKGKTIAKHDPTPFREPWRSWKLRPDKKNPNRKEILQIYLDSKPAPPTRGHFPFADRGTY